MAFFEGNNMTAGYGDGPDIISSCTLNADKGEIVAILGPNGAGKSTAMKSLLGLLNLKSGNVKIDGEDISKFSPQEIMKYIQNAYLLQQGMVHLDRISLQ